MALDLCAMTCQREQTESIAPQKAPGASAWVNARSCWRIKSGWALSCRSGYRARLGFWPVNRRTSICPSHARCIFARACGLQPPSTPLLLKRFTANTRASANASNRLNLKRTSAIQQNEAVMQSTPHGDSGRPAPPTTTRIHIQKTRNCSSY